MTTSAERLHLARVASLGCIICGYPAEVHHIKHDPLVKKGIQLSEKTWAAIDFARGTQTRADWLREAIKTALLRRCYDAVTTLLRRRE